ncbi:L,D-transpeptidase/peptidoglycan binding protein [Candidatus Berkelbacteria bacterium]|nr:L,D-transpeptidase/peptidoglycan binding protein [Candidatus Berkelbacteria bacterium]
MDINTPVKLNWSIAAILIELVAVGLLTTHFVYAKSIFKTASASGNEIDEVEATLSRFQTISNTKLVLKYEKATFEPDQKTVASWLDVANDASGNMLLYINQEKITEYLKPLSKEFNVTSKPRLVDPDGVVIAQGQYGRKLDEQKTIEDIRLALSGGNPEITLLTTVTPGGEKQVAKAFTPGLYEGKYIEVNLTTQTLYQFEGQNLIASRRVSTGKWSTPTPIGSFNINNKVGRAYSKRYNLYMPYWMAFNGSSYGMHELPEWPGGRKEGESHLGTPVSHGCIRLGVGEAQQVYDWVDVGTPVVIRKG